MKKNVVSKYKRYKKVFIMREISVDITAPDNSKTDEYTDKELKRLSKIRYGLQFVNGTRKFSSLFGGILVGGLAHLDHFLLIWITIWSEKKRFGFEKREVLGKK